MDFYAQYKKYENDLNYNDDGDPENPVRVLTVGLACTMYFRGGSTQPVRHAIADCFEKFYELFQEKLVWFTAPEEINPGHRASFLKKKPLFPFMREHIKGMHPDDCLEWMLSSAKSQDEVSDCYMYALGTRRWEIEVRDPMDWLSFTVPIEAVYGPNGNAELFTDLVRYCCEKLDPVHGCAGPASLLPEQSNAWLDQEFDVQQRYFGLDVASKTFFDALHLQNSIRTTNWLTLLGQDMEWAARSHPEWKTFDNRPEGIGAWKAGKTLVIQAGAQPNLAPIVDGIPPLYKFVSDALKPIRRKEARSMHTGAAFGEINFNKPTSDMWLRRFDEPGIWPPYPSHLEYFKVDETINEYQAPAKEDAPVPQQALHSEYSSDRALPGDKCPKSGNWFALHLRQTVWVNEGDIMPGPKTSPHGNEVIWYLKV